MSNQLRYLVGYRAMVDSALRTMPEAEAMAHAVGGAYERTGTLEHALLRQQGLRDDDFVVDVGCGSGRLATQLARVPRLRYLGTDVVPALLDYAQRHAARPDFRFEHLEEIRVPVPDGAADLVCFFSVFTHILHEESYVYLADSHRALRPGGRVVFSFLEYAVPVCWPVMEENVAWVRQRTPAAHLNVFMHRDDLRLWAARLGFEVVTTISGDNPAIVVDAATATAAAPAGRYSLGQSVCVLRKPG